MSNTLTGSISGTASGATICTGAGVDVYRIIALRSALGMLGVGLKMRGMTLSRALDMTMEYTGKRFKRTQIEEARKALKEAADAMRARLSDVNLAN